MHDLYGECYFRLIDHFAKEKKVTKATKHISFTGWRLKAAVIAVCFGSLNGLAFGGDISGAGYITELYINALGDFVRIKFSEPVKNPDNCEAAEFYVRELEDTRGATRFLAILASAYFERKKVAVYIAGCSRNKWWGATRPQLYDIYVVGD